MSSASTIRSHRFGGSQVSADRGQQGEPFQRSPRSTASRRNQLDEIAEGKSKSAYLQTYFLNRFLPRRISPTKSLVSSNHPLLPSISLLTPMSLLLPLLTLITFFLTPSSYHLLLLFSYHNPLLLLSAHIAYIPSPHPPSPYPPIPPSPSRSHALYGARDHRGRCGRRFRGRGLGPHPRPRPQGYGPPPSAVEPRTSLLAEVGRDFLAGGAATEDRETD